jgi:hypothetical protein
VRDVETQIVVYIIDRHRVILEREALPEALDTARGFEWKLAKVAHRLRMPKVSANVSERICQIIFVTITQLLEARFEIGMKPGGLPEVQPKVGATGTPHRLDADWQPTAVVTTDVICCHLN